MRRLNIQLTEQQYEALRVLAFRERRSIADVIRVAVDNCLKVDNHLKKEDAHSDEDAQED